MAVKTKGVLEGILPEELMKLLFSLAANWGDVVDYAALKTVNFSGAMTNGIYRISWPTEMGDAVTRTVWVRIYGDGVELFFNREEAVMTFESLSTRGYGPKLLGQFQGGKIEDFIKARTLTAEDLRNPETAALIAAKMREFHLLEMQGPKEVTLWNKLRNLLCEAKNLCSPDHAREFLLDSLEREICSLEKEISVDHQEMGFCHNNMQYGNIMVNDHDRAIYIIDYEYAGYNPVAFDIANLFCEMAANYHTDTPHILDYSKYPDMEERKRFIQKYLSSSGNDSNETTLEQIIDDVEKYTLANHMFWGLRGLISAYVHKHIGFNYMEYARQRFNRYWLTKLDVLKVQGIFLICSKTKRALII